jgi:hypothetical protein
VVGIFIKPDTDDFEHTRYYLQNTNVLCTEFYTSSGKFRNGHTRQAVPACDADMKNTTVEW